MERSPQSPLPDPTGGILTEIDQQCCSAYALRDIAKQLFYAKPECAELWNEISGSAALDLRDTLRDALIIAICRLTDRPKVGKNRNCSLEALVIALEDTVDQQVCVHLNDRVSKIDKLCEPLRDHRDKRIGHVCMTVNVEGTFSLPQCSASMIDNALSAVSSFLQEVQRLVEWPQMIYELGDYGGSTVLMYLEAGRKLFDLQEAIGRNTMSPEDICSEIKRYNGSA